MKNLSIVFLALLVLAACCRKGEEPIAVEGVSLPATVAIVVNGTYELKADISPINAADKSLIWYIDKPGFATMDQNGVITGKAVGKAVIVVTSKSNMDKSAKCEVEVMKEKAASIAIAPEKPEVVKGRTLELKATVLPADAAQAVTWSSEDPAKATIDAATGVVNALEAGTTLITATAADGSGVTGEVTLTVQSQADATATITSITLGAEKFVVGVPNPGQTTKLDNAPHTIAADLTKVQVNIIATEGAVIKIGEATYSKDKTVDFTHSVTFSVTEAGKMGSKEYILTITRYNKESNPYGIYTAAHLHDVRNAVSAGFKLMNDITMPAASDGLTGIGDYKDEGWLPIGGEETPFTGSLDGAGLKIENFYTKRAALYVGLFGKIGGGAIIKDIEVKGMAGAGTEKNPFYAVTGTAGNNNQYTGMLAGYSEGLIRNCYTSGNVTSNSSSPMTTSTAAAGGLVGFCNGGTVSDSYTSGQVQCTAASADVMAGGLVGYCDNAATIVGCYSAGHAGSYAYSNASSSYSGGLVGHCDNGTTINRSYSTAFAVAGSNSTVDDNFRLEGAIAGGLVGSCNKSSGSNRFSTVNNCYATGNVISTCSLDGGFAIVGGLVGAMYNCRLYNSYATGNVVVAGDKGYQHLSTVLGYYYTDATIRSNCYRNSDATATKANSFDGKPPKSYYGTAKTLAEMKTTALRDNLNEGQATAVWGWSTGKNNALPYIIGVGEGK